jgi:hypothetical protein
MKRALTAACLALAACDAYAFAWDSSSGILIIGFVNGGTSIGVVVEAPDTVARRRRIRCHGEHLRQLQLRPGPERLDVEVNGAVARLTPYDRVAPPNSVCTADLGAHPHTASVTFPNRAPPRSRSSAARNREIPSCGRRSW